MDGLGVTAPALLELFKAAHIREHVIKDRVTFIFPPQCGPPNSAYALRLRGHATLVPWLASRRPRR